MYFSVPTATPSSEMTETTTTTTATSMAARRGRRARRKAVAAKADRRSGGGGTAFKGDGSVAVCVCVMAPTSADSSRVAVALLRGPTRDEGAALPPAEAPGADQRPADQPTTSPPESDRTAIRPQEPSWNPHGAEKKKKRRGGVWCLTNDETWICVWLQGVVMCVVSGVCSGKIRRRGSACVLVEGAIGRERRRCKEVRRPTRFQSASRALAPATVVRIWPTTLSATTPTTTPSSLSH